jgi:hypothetical protein
MVSGVIEPLKAEGRQFDPAPDQQISGCYQPSHLRERRKRRLVLADGEADLGVTADRLVVRGRRVGS